MRPPLGTHYSLSVSVDLPILLLSCSLKAVSASLQPPGRQHSRLSVCYCLTLPIVCSVASVVSDSRTPRSAVCQAPLCPWDSPGKNTWNGLPCPAPGDLPNPGAESASSAAPALQADSLLLSHQRSPFWTLPIKWNPLVCSPLCLASVTYHNVFRGGSSHRMHQYSIP